jgi:hypothetical protein
MSRSMRVFAAATLAMMNAAAPSVAADAPRPTLAPGGFYLPAVSQPNGKLSAFGGTIDGHQGGGITGAFSLPVDRQWGLQGDVLAGTAGGGTFWGLAGHAFWRNPAQGLLGLYGSWVDWSPVGAEVTKIGLEGEWYNGPFSFEGKIAMQGGTFSGTAWSATAAMYAQENFRLDLSARNLEGVGTTFGVGAEWQHDASGLALFGNGNWAWGGSTYSTLIAGVRFYAGPPKSLIRRHREDDPGVDLTNDLEQVAPPEQQDPCAAG